MELWQAVRRPLLRKPPLTPRAIYFANRACCASWQRRKALSRGWSSGSVCQRGMLATARSQRLPLPNCYTAIQSRSEHLRQLPLSSLPITHESAKLVNRERQSTYYPIHSRCICSRDSATGCHPNKPLAKGGKPAFLTHFSAASLLTSSSSLSLFACCGAVCAASFVFGALPS